LYIFLYRSHFNVQESISLGQGSLQVRNKNFSVVILAINCGTDRQTDSHSDHQSSCVCLSVHLTDHRSDTQLRKEWDMGSRFSRTDRNLEYIDRQTDGHTSLPQIIFPLYNHWTGTTKCCMTFSLFHPSTMQLGIGGKRRMLQKVLFFTFFPFPQEIEDY
jgi:hypothetical protein